MAKRSPEKVLDVLDALGDAAIDAETERVLAMSTAERESELRAAGVDVEAEKAKALAWRDKARRGELPIESAERKTEQNASKGQGGCRTDGKK